MKYAIIFLGTMVILYLLVGFVNLTLDFTQWDTIARIVFSFVAPVVGVFAILAYRVGEDDDAVIIRDKKTGRFKKK